MVRRSRIVEHLLGSRCATEDSGANAGRDSTMGRVPVRRGETVLWVAECPSHRKG